MEEEEDLEWGPSEAEETKNPSGEDKKETVEVAGRGAQNDMAEHVV